MKDLRHSNVNAFIGACIDHPRFTILTEYCSKGSLQVRIAIRIMNMKTFFKNKYSFILLVYWSIAFSMIFLK